MKTKQRHELLEELLPADAAPGFDTVLAYLRHEHQARANRRRAVTILAATMACLAAVVLATRPSETKPVVSLAAGPLPPTIPEIRRISDDELQASIDRPSAIVTLPDGRKSLLVLMPAKTTWRR
jgi:hypothetical protein